MPKPVVGITLGDPAGIGPEVVSKALLHPGIHSLCRLLVFGAAIRLAPFPRNSGFEYVQIRHPRDAAFEQKRIPFVDVKTGGRIFPGRHTAVSGRAALAYLDCAIESTTCGEIDALVTAPVSKAAIQMAGNPAFTGHTEYLAEKTGARSFAMMFYGKRFLVSLVTTHLPLRAVADAVSRKKIADVISLSHAAAEKFGRLHPRIGVAGLNPHAGERGTLGDEDERVVAPAVADARRKKITAEGPIPADVLFRLAYRGEFDVVVAMYHDQALAPFKMISFERGVNITLGLPFVRTSVDHGTAADIAGKGVASEASMVEAIRLAVRLVK